MKNRVVSGLLLAAFVVTTLAVTPLAAGASEKGRRNTTLLLGAGTLYSILRKKTVPALALGAGTYYAYRRYRQAKEHRRVRNAYASGYRTAAYRRGSRSYRPASYRTAGYRSRYYRTQTVRRQRRTARPRWHRQVVYRYY